QIETWLRESPALSGAEVLRRAREVGYRGGKSALYELVRRLRVPVAASLTVVPSNGTQASR
ncbi:MAG: IS21 family transposase, partial [Candidatus Rokuibacteriota bacterium]